jgi:exodeoxyribonuclease III
MKIVSWNVNGLRAAVKKGFAQVVAELDPEMLCIQETKAQDDQIADALADLNGYHLYCNSAERKGYSGTAILSKTEPLDISKGIGIEEHDQEGRILTADFGDFYLVAAYVPNSGNGLARLDYRKQWDKDFLAFLKNLENEKPVIVGGDFNVAHEEIDIARPKANYNKTAGYTQTEIDGFNRFVDAGFVDAFRALHPDTVAYSWWSFRANARAKNIGWRIDYFLVSSELLSKVKKACLRSEIMGSDHCPVGLEINTGHGASR